MNVCVFCYICYFVRFAGLRFHIRHYKARIACIFTSVTTKFESPAYIFLQTTLSIGIERHSRAFVTSKGIRAFIFTTSADNPLADPFPKHAKSSSGTHVFYNFSEQSTSRPLFLKCRSFKRNTRFYNFNRQSSSPSLSWHKTGASKYPNVFTSSTENQLAGPFPKNAEASSQFFKKKNHFNRHWSSRPLS